MEVEFACDCGQALRAEVTDPPLSVQCPRCGRVLTVRSDASMAMAQPPPVYVRRRVSGKATAALVFGLCGLIPFLGLIAAPIGIALGIAVLVKKLDGRGFGIAGIATGAAGLLIVQTVAGLLTFAIFMAVQTFTRARGAWATATTAPYAAVQLADEQIAADLTFVFPPTGDAAAAAEALAKARDLYARRKERPGNLYECVRLFAHYLARRDNRGFAEAKDAALHEAAQQELIRTVTDAYRRAEKLEQAGKWKQGEAAWKKVREMVPGSDSGVGRSATDHEQNCAMMQQVTPEDLTVEPPSAPPPPSDR